MTDWKILKIPGERYFKRSVYDVSLGIKFVSFNWAMPNLTRTDGY